MLAPFFTAICLSTVPSNGQEACNKALQAASVQSGVEPTLEKAQGLVTAYMQVQAEKTFGRDLCSAAAAAYTIGSQRRIQFTTKQVPLVERTSVGVTPDSATLQFGWSF